MKFSVLIANYNNSRYLATALDSVLAQSYTNWEIVLVDDASTDDFFTVVEPYLQDPRIHLFHNDFNHGCGFTKKRCVDLADGEILGFLDPDDQLDSEALKVMIMAHQQNRNCGIIHSTHFVCDENLVVKRVAEYVRALPENTPYLLLNDGRIHHFATFRKSNYLQTPGIEATNLRAVDQDLYYKLEETGSVMYLEQPLYYYRIHPGGISTTGKESETAIVHYAIVRDRCRIRIAALKKQSPSYNRQMIKRYRTRYFKISAFYWSRKGNWFYCLSHLLVYPFVGGASNLIGYMKKFPQQGFGLLKKSFVSNYEIK
ncbi:MAG: glycosyltransferase family 2 protein [Chitinophagaceae bacterium]|nr:glycosyltransferase family 2 protein [Chitinophagaceae bacterium]